MPLVTAALHPKVFEYKGHDLLGVRVWAQTENGWLPAKKGITVNVRLIPELVAALKKAEARGPDCQGVTC